MAAPPGPVEACHNVIVIGAGFSGLYAAQMLRASGCSDVLVVEAQSHVGGRVRQLHGFAGWPIEIGPEFGHGANSKLTQVMAAMGLAATEKPWPDHYWFGHTGQLVGDEDAPAEVDQLHDFFENIGDEQPPPAGADVSAEAWLRAKGASELQLELADVCYGNDFAASLRQLGVREMITENQRWDDGDTYLVLNQSIGKMVQRLATGLTIRTDWPVSRLCYDAHSAVLTGPDGARLRARKVVVTASLAVLQAGRIAFVPPLPEAKAGALRRLRMGNAAKIVVAFNRRFWPDTMYDVVCTHSFVPEFWMTRHEITDASHAHLHAVVGFVAGPRADKLSRMQPEDAVSRFLQQLDNVFGSTADPTPATASYVKAHVFDWSNEPWVGGAYTFPCHGVEAGDREALAAPVNDTLFFAGEATDASVNPCMQAALDSGERAAREVLAALSQEAHVAPSSRL